MGLTLTTEGGRGAVGYKPAEFTVDRDQAQRSKSREDPVGEQLGQATGQ